MKISVLDVINILVTVYDHDDDLDIHHSYLKLCDEVGDIPDHYVCEGVVGLSMTIYRSLEYLHSDVKLEIGSNNFKRLTIDFIKKFMIETRIILSHNEIDLVTIKKLIYPEDSLNQIYRKVLLDVQKKINEYNNTKNK